MSATSNQAQAPKDLDHILYDRLTTHIKQLISKFITCLKRKEITGAFGVTTGIVAIFRVIVKSWKHTTAKEFIQLIRTVGLRIHQAQPLEFTIGNVTQRVETFIREAHEVVRKEKQTGQKMLRKLDSVGSQSSLQSYMRPDNSDAFSKSLDSGDIKEKVLTDLEEFISEITDSYSVIAEQAQEHIHANEVIMTYGRSKTVEDFLLAAASFRKFEVIVAESAPSGWGKHTAKKLASEGISCTLISDSAVFAMMARVNKVIVGTHAVMANGGLIAHTGLHVMALAAKFHSVPLVVCTGIYKLCPLYPYDQNTFQDLNSPGAVLPFNELDQGSSLVEVVNPAYDYIPPELVSILVTNTGGHPPSYMYRFLAEFYHHDDNDIAPQSLLYSS